MVGRRVIEPRDVVGEGEPNHQQGFARRWVQNPVRAVPGALATADLGHRCEQGGMRALPAVVHAAAARRSQEKREWVLPGSFGGTQCYGDSVMLLRAKAPYPA